MKSFALLLLLSGLHVSCLLPCVSSKPNERWWSLWRGKSGARPLDSNKIPLPAQWITEQNRSQYMGLHNDLPALLQAQSRDNWVSMFSFSSGIKRMALNCIYSFVRYGGQSSYIVTAWDPLALDMCISLQLPCYNATHMAKDMEHRVASYNETAPESILAQQLLGWQPVQHPLGRRMQAHSTGVTNSNSHRSAMPPHQHRARRLKEDGNAAGSTPSMAIAHAFGTHGFLVLAWARVLLLEQVLQLGYTVHMSDSDVVYMRKAYPVFNETIKNTRADALFMRESYLSQDDASLVIHHLNLINTGMLVLASTAQTIALVQNWVTVSPIAIRWGMNEQMTLARMAYKKFILCEDRAECVAAKMAGHVVAYRHPTQFQAPEQPTCMRPTSMARDPCAQRVYIHLICLFNAREKAEHLHRNQLWLVDSEGHPMYAEDSHLAAIQQQTAAAKNATAPLQGRAATHAHKDLRPHPYLPCLDHVVWA